MLVVDDLDRSIAFYRDVLGFRLLQQRPWIAALSLGNMNLYVFTHSPPTPDKPGVTLANRNTPDETPVVLSFQVDDCRAAYEDLRELGLEFLTPPMEPPFGGWRCFARDPDGYLIELEQPLESPFD